MDSIRIGSFDNMDVFFDTEETTNKHVLFMGTSGSGKSVGQQMFITNILNQGGTVVAINSHGVFEDDQIHPALLPTINRYRNDIDLSKGGICFPLFDSIKYKDGSVERAEDTIGAITDIISRPLKLGVVQKRILRNAIDMTYFEGSYRKFGFLAIRDKLQSMNHRIADELVERLYPLFARNIFVDGDNLIKDNKLSIIQISKLDLETQGIVTEIILSLIWRLANAGKFKKNEIFLMLDECQNLDTNAKGPLALFLSEGRKMGVNLIMGTQMVLQGTTNTVQQRLTQAGLILCFKPASNRIGLTAKMIEPGNDTKWLGTLATLKVGEFIAMGTLKIAGRSIHYPLKVDGFIGSRKQLDSTKYVVNKTVNGVKGGNNYAE